MRARWGQRLIEEWILGPFLQLPAARRSVRVEPGRGIEPLTYSLRVNRSAD